MRNALPDKAYAGFVNARYRFFPAKAMRRDESGVVNISDARVPSVRMSEATEPLTPEASVRIFVDETAISERFCDRKIRQNRLQGARKN